MDRNQIIESIGEEITRLQRVKELLTNGSNHYVHHSNGNGSHPKKRILSTEARNRIAEAQKRRWAKHRKEAASRRG